MNAIKAVKIKAPRQEGIIISDNHRGAIFIEKSELTEFIQIIAKVLKIAENEGWK